MTPNSTIYSAFCTALDAANLGYAIAWMAGGGQDKAGNYMPSFTPPSGEHWLEVSYLPNNGVQNGIANNATTIEQGIFQVSACGRNGVGAGRGMVPTQLAANEVQALFARGLAISGAIRVSRSYQMPPIQSDDKITVPVTIEYSR